MQLEATQKAYNIDIKPLCQSLNRAVIRSKYIHHLLVSDVVIGDWLIIALPSKKYPLANYQLVGANSYKYRYALMTPL